MARPRVVVIGAGFGGFAVVEELEGVPVDVILIDRNNYHTFQPLLYQVATADLEAADIAYPARCVTRKLANADFRFGEVTGVDWDAREVVLADGDREAFTHLVLAVGLTTHFFGVKGAREHALPMKTVEEALAIRGHLLRAYEDCAKNPTLVSQGGGTVVVVGGGPTGVELAGALTELFRNLRSDYPKLDHTSNRVILVEHAADLLGPFKPKRRAYAKKQLQRMGVEVRNDESVSEVTPEGVMLSSGSSILARTVIWSAGVTPAPFIEELGLELARGHRIVVDHHQRVKGHDGVFAVGDIAASLLADDSVIPQLAQPAIQTGKHVARVIRAELEGREPVDFRYRDRGTMATIGRRRAVVELRSGRGFAGAFAWLAWLFLHITYLAGFRNRMHVMVNWVWNYLTFDRGARLITDKPPLDESSERPA